MRELSYPQMIAALSSVIALVISVVTLIRSRRLDEDQRDLRRITEELSKKQLERLKAEDDAAHRTRVVAKFSQSSDGWKFYLRNTGSSPAIDVGFEMVDCARSPLIPGQVKEVFPFRMLQPGAEISLLAAVTLGSPPVFHTRVSWTNSDGSKNSADYSFTL